MNKIASALLLTALLSPPAPAQNKGPSPADVARARSLGEQAARSDGELDGSECGKEEGYRRGFKEGRDENFSRLVKQFEKEAFDRGYAVGLGDGQRSGIAQGSADGEREGRAQGRRDGEREGLARAEREGQRDAEGPGRQAGSQDAEASDARQVGRREGSEAGDSEARRRARENDYVRGQESVRALFYGKTVKGSGNLNLEATGHSPGGGPLAWGEGAALVAVENHRRHFSPKPARHFPTPVEDKAYEDGYCAKYKETFESHQRNAASQARDRGRSEGAEEARREVQRKSFDYQFQSAAGKGRDDGYRQTYPRAKEQAFRPTFESEFRLASTQAFNASYPAVRERHFANFRQQAYTQRYAALRSESAQQARVEVEALKYPIYAKQALAQGKKDEEQDFIARPLRITTAQGPVGPVTPSSPVHFKVVIRNFGPDLAAGEVRIQVNVDDVGAVYMPDNTFVSRARLTAGGLGETLQEIQATPRAQSVGKTLKFLVQVYRRGILSDERPVEISVGG